MLLWININPMQYSKYNTLINLLTGLLSVTMSTVDLHLLGIKVKPSSVQLSPLPNS